MPNYIATVRARFAEAAEDDLEAFRTKLRKRKAFRMPGHDIMQNGPHVWITAAVLIQAATPAEAAIDALHAFEQDAATTVGAFNALDLGAVPREAMLQQIPL